jgi:putative transposase
MTNQNYIQFFTATILWWKKLLKPDKYKQIIMESLRFLVDNQRVKIYGFVLMPNHVHLIWRINPDHVQQDVQRDFLKYTAQQIKFDLQTHHPQVLAHFEVNLKDRQYQFWERNALSIDLYDRKVVEQKLVYIHNNPIQPKWNLVSDPAAYWYSSFRFYEYQKDDFGFLTHYMEDY